MPGSFLGVTLSKCQRCGFFYHRNDRHIVGGPKCQLSVLKRADRQKPHLFTYSSGVWYIKAADFLPYAPHDGTQFASGRLTVQQVIRVCRRRGIPLTLSLPYTDKDDGHSLSAVSRHRRVVFGPLWIWLLVQLFCWGTRHEGTAFWALAFADNLEKVAAHPNLQSALETMYHTAMVAGASGDATCEMVVSFLREELGDAHGRKQNGYPTKLGVDWAERGAWGYAI